MMFFILLIVILYLYTTRNHNYWAKRGVKHEQPLPFFGNHLPNLLLQRNTVDVGAKLYKAYPKERFVGYYIGNTPQLIIRDPEILKYIFNVDFNYFTSRGMDLNLKKRSLLRNLFFAGGEDWRFMRNRFSSAFTPGKLKAMFPLIVKCTEKLVKRLDMQCKEVEAYELMAGYTMEFIASCGFGVDLNTISNTHFTYVAKSFFDRTDLQTFIINLDEICSFTKILPGIQDVNSKFNSFILGIAKKVQEERNYKPSGKNDFMDILLQMIQSEDKEKHKSDAEREEDLWFIAGQIFVFLVAGYETSAVATSVTLHQLSFNQQLQDKVRQEVDTVLSKYNGQLCHDAVCEMTRLEMAYKEGMRIQPPGCHIRRTCTKTYTIPGTDITIDPGVKILAPIQVIQNDPQYFDSPEEFRPERFSPEAEKDISEFVYMPFGSGPRKCPGARLGNLQSIAGLASILHRFIVEPTPSTRRDYKIKRSSFIVQVIEGGLPLHFKPRNT